MKNAALNKLSAIILFCLILPQLALAASPVARDISAKVIKDTQNSTLNTLKLQASDADAGDILSYTLLSLPLHGQLKEEAIAEPITTVPYLLSSSKLKYIPEPNFIGQDSFTYKATDTGSDSNTATVTLNVVEWFPPIGIPEPSFGIKETYRMYDDPAKRNPALTYTQNAEGGYYTHYVDNIHLNANDTNNPYGTADKPRRTIPRGSAALAAGSVVEIHNSADANGWGECNIEGVGMADRPIFVRGVNLPRIPIFMDVGYYGNASYIIVEGISFFSGSALGRQNGTDFDTNHIAIRKCDFHGDQNGGGTSVTAWTTNSVRDIVLYGNVIHDNGVWDPAVATGDQDNHGIGVGGTSYLWVVDNEMYHNSGDGIQINGGNSGTENTHHIYVGRNRSHHNKQSGLWTKTAADVIFSENIAWGHRQSSSAPGPGMGFQYDPKRVWFLFNKSYDNALGIHCGSGNVGGREEFYFIGNVLYDVGSGISLNGLNTPQPAKVIGNTIYNTEYGIANWYYTSSVDIVNNIISSSVEHVHFGSDYNTAAVSNISNTLFDGSAKLLWSNSYANLSQFQQATGECAGCMEANPEFVDPQNNNFDLQQTSPAIDAGAVSEVYQRFYELYGIDISKDIAGRTRPQGSAWDIGAYEYVPQGAVLYGDVSSDNEISAYDAALAAQAAVGLITLTLEQTQKADVSGDAEVSAYDAALIAQRAVGLIDKFPVEG